MHQTELVIRGRRVVTETFSRPGVRAYYAAAYISSISIFEDVPAGADLIEAAPESSSCRGWSTLMYTSTNQAAQTGRDLKRPRAQPRRAASPQLSICL
jgi:hypothetical protein